MQKAQRSSTGIGFTTMNVKELREYLSDFPDNAKVLVVVGCRPVDFSMAFGCADGGTKKTAIDVAFHVDSRQEIAQSLCSCRGRQERMEAGEIAGWFCEKHGHFGNR